jgi:hypothetical protein
LGHAPVPASPSNEYCAPHLGQIQAFEAASAVGSSVPGSTCSKR